MADISYRLKATQLSRMSMERKLRQTIKSGSLMESQVITLEHGLITARWVHRHRTRRGPFVYRIENNCQVNPVARGSVVYGRWLMFTTEEAESRRLLCFTGLRELEIKVQE